MVIGARREEAEGARRGPRQSESPNIHCERSPAWPEWGTCLNRPSDLSSRSSCQLPLTRRDAILNVRVADSSLNTRHKRASAQAEQLCRT